MEAPVRGWILGGEDDGTRPQLQLMEPHGQLLPQIRLDLNRLLSKFGEAYVSIRKEGGAGGAAGVPQSVLCAFVMAGSGPREDIFL